MNTEAQSQGRWQHARVLAALGDLHEAEAHVAEVLDEVPEDLTALSLFAKLKHMRGELSQAIACWAQLHARSPHNETALMHLGGILHLAQDPERNAGEFIALGQFQLARKPAAHLELEEAFRLFLARRPDEARAHCEQLAQRYQGRDREVHKLAVLANAWIAELSGDLDGACAVLESLGKERGFEDDTDRILALVRVYERSATPERLSAAVNICRYLDRRFEKISVQSRLAALYRRLGKTALADECDDRYLAAFRRRMHRPTLAEVLRVAAARFIPIERLRTLRFPSLALPPEATIRERAIGLALTGDLSAAREGFRQGGALIDRMYLANAAALAIADAAPADPRAAAQAQKRRATALRAFIEALRDERSVEDLAAIAWILDRRDDLDEATEALLRDPAIGPPMRRVLEESIRATPLDAARWRQLSSLLGVLGEPEEAARCRARSLALAEAASRDLRPVGRALAAGVYHFVGKAKGIIHQVWAGRHAGSSGRGGWLPDDQILGNLTAEMKDGARNTFLAVREYARSKFPHRTGDILDYSYTFKVTKEDEPSGGLSAGLPTAIAFLSVFLQEPVPQDVAMSGVLISEAHDVLTVRAVGEAEFKVKAAYNRDLPMLVLPLANRAALEQSAQVPRTVCTEIVRYAATLDDAVRLIFGDDVFVHN